MKTRSPPASLSCKGQATKQETVKWSIGNHRRKGQGDGGGSSPPSPVLKIFGQNAYDSGKSTRNKYLQRTQSMRGLKKLFQ